MSFLIRAYWTLFVINKSRFLGADSCAPARIGKNADFAGSRNEDLHFQREVAYKNKHALERSILG